ncbi:Rne/Rng family ribonuclease [Cellulomonas sp. Y8]|uniref:Rne/Rng family ribonuclease n=1 Tax=Cellulomonas sp. Y8 TaxID=2591145 RepID=UPI003D745EB9
MTLDNTSDSTTTAAQTGGDAPAESAAPARKRTTRTRATRATKAAEPAADTLDFTVGDGAEAAAPAEEAPAKPVRRRAPRKTAAQKAAEAAAEAETGAPAAEAAPAEVAPAADAAPAAAAPAADGTPAAPAAEEAPAAPKRRRATRKAAAPAEPPAAAAPAAPAAAAAPASVVTETPAEPVTAEAPAAPEASAAPARRSRRATRPAGAGAAASSAAPEAAAAPAVEAPAAPAPEAVEEADEDAVIEQPEDEQVAEAVEQAEETSAAAPESRLDVLAELGRSQSAGEREPARRSRGRRSGSRKAGAPDAAASEAAEQQPAAEQPAATEPQPAAQKPAADKPATRQPAGQKADQDRAASARLATTALLFQAPEAPRRRRRAQAPSGSPEAISAAAQADLEAAQAAEAAAAEAEAPQDAPAEEQAAPSRRRGRRGRSRAERAEAAAEETTDAVEAEDAAAVEAAAADEADEEAEEAAAERAEDEGDENAPRRRRRRGGRGRRSRGGSDAEQGEDDAEQPSDEGDEQAEDAEDREDEADEQAEGDEQGGSSRRRRRRRRSGRGGGDDAGEQQPSSRRSSSRGGDEVTALRGSTRLEAKRQRRREGRDAGRRRQIITEAEFLARRESVERSMVVREAHGKTQIAVLEDGVLVEHYVSRQAQVSMAGNVYLGRVQNVLPSMEAAFVDVGKGRNAVLYAGEVNWDAAGLDGGQPRRIEQALKSGDSVLVQVTKDPIGHKGARLTSQITLAGRYLVYVPGGGMTGISRKLPEPERARLKKILREVVPDSAGVIVRTAAEGASEEELRADIARLQSQWEAIEKKSKTANAPALLQGEPDLAIRVVRDIFNDDFSSLVVQGDEAWSTISGYIGELAPDLAEKVSKYTGTGDVFADHRVDEQLAKGMDRKVWLPSGGSLVIDRTEAMTVVDVNTGKFTGAGGTLEETVTRNNLEAAEEIVRQLRLRDIGGIIVIDFIDMVLESNRDLVLRRLVECLGRDRTKHQVAEVTSLGLVQMTRKRVGQGLVEAFSETCEHCNGRGFIVHAEPVEKHNHKPEAGAPQQPAEGGGEAKKARRKRGGSKEQAPAPAATPAVPVLPEARDAVKATLATIAAAAAHAHAHDGEEHPAHGDAAEQPAPAAQAPAEAPAEAPAPVEAAADAPAEAKPALDVLAALGDLAARSPEQPATAPAAGEPHLELTPVDPGLFELSGTESDPEDDAS